MLIKTFEAACKLLKVKSSDVLPVFNPGLDEITNKALIAHAKLVIIAKTLNEDWIPGWNNSNEYKYYPWFDLRNGGLVFIFVFYDFTCSYVGSRLCFKSRELAEYAGKTFVKLYQEYMK